MCPQCLHGSATVCVSFCCLHAATLISCIMGYACLFVCLSVHPVQAVNLETIIGMLSLPQDRNNWCANFQLKTPKSPLGLSVATDCSSDCRS